MAFTDADPGAVTEGHVRPLGGFSVEAFRAELPRFGEVLRVVLERLVGEVDDRPGLQGQPLFERTPLDADAAGPGSRRVHP